MPKHVDRVGDLSFQRPESVDLTRRELAALLKDGTLRFDVSALSRREVQYTMSSSGQESAYSAGRLPVLRFFASGVHQFWVGTAIRYRDKNGVLAPSSVSVEIVEGLLAGGAKRPLLRAEWDWWEERSSHHAQPHWHVTYSDQATIEQGFTPGSQQISEFGAGSIVIKGKGDIRISPMHFAMYARWHLGNPEDHVTPLSEAEIPAWIVGCLCYARNQVEYSLEDA
jgi:hypothetical protein